MPGDQERSFFRKIISFISYQPPKRNIFVLPEQDSEASFRVPEKERENMNYNGFFGEQGADQGDESGNTGSEGGGDGEGSAAGQKPDKDNSQKPALAREKIRKPVRASDWKKIKETGGKANGEEEKGRLKGVISPDLKFSLELAKKEFNHPENIDVVIREFRLARKVDAFIFFTDSMVDRNVINNFILRQLMNPLLFDKYEGGCPFDYILSNVLAVNEVRKVKDYDTAFKQVTMGLTVLFVDGCSSCLLIETRGFEKREIGKTSIEAVVRGSQEGFTENIKTSLSQVRRLVKNKDFVSESATIGTCQTMAFILYIKGVTNPAIVKEVKRRIKSIKTDFISGDGMLEHFIEDNNWTTLPQIFHTERPDSVANQITEGRVAILVEGTPFALIVPVSVFTFLQSPEDFHLRWQYASFTRTVRLLAFYIALLLPGTYIALFNYHIVMVPTILLVAIAEAREGVPFPALVELMLLEISFELIREAGIRVPGLVGTTLGIIGALILGQAAVAAGIVSPMIIIVTAVTGLGSFAIPNFSFAFGVRILRFFFIAMGGLLGFFGVSVGLVIVAATAAGMKSFGVPFLAPLAPKTREFPELFYRKPIWLEEDRPDEINPLNKRRQPEISRGWTRQDPPAGNRE